MIFSNRKGVSPLIAAVLLIAFTMAVAAILTAWIAGFTNEQRDRTEVFDKKISCAYSNIEADRDYAKWDATDKIFYTLISNTGVEAVTVTKVETWVGNTKQIPIFLNDSYSGRIIDKNAYTELYINLSSAFSSGTGELTKIKFFTECEPVFDTITQPQGSWTAFDWTTEELAN